MMERIQGMIARGIVRLVSDSLQMQGVQIELLDGEAHDEVERFQDYGFTSVPHGGAEAVAICPGGLRSHAIVIRVDDRRYRLGGMEGGEVALYDDLGQVVHLKRDGILVSSPMKVIVEAPELHLGGEGGQPVARVGDAVSGGAIAAGSSVVSAL